MFSLKNVNAIAYGLYLGLISAAASPSLLEVLMFTKQSSTPQLAYRRYMQNVLHGTAWNKFNLEPGTK